MGRKTGRTERRGRIRARVGDQACVYTERRRVAQRRRSGEGEINVFVLRPPSYALLGERRLGCSREKVSRRSGWPRRHGPAPRRISAQRYCFCVQRTSVSPSFPLLHHRPSPPIAPFLRASRFFEARMCAFLRFDLNRVLNSLYPILKQKVVNN